MTERWIRFSIGLVVIAAAAYVLYRLRFVLVTLALAAMLAYAVMPLVDRVTRIRIAGREIPRIASVSAVFVLLALGAVALVALTAGAVAGEVRRLAEHVPVYRDELGNAVGSLPAVLGENFPADISQTIQDAVSRAGTILVDTLAGFVGATAKWLGHATELILVPLLAFYFLIDLPALKEELVQFIPTSSRPHALLVARHLDRIFAGYVRGQVVLIVVAAAAVWGMLMALRMPYALVLSLVAAIMRIIPVVGPFLATIPIVGLALLQSATLGLYVLVFLLVLQVIESKVLLPAVMGRQLQLHAATIILALLIGNALFGLVGAFLAAPVAATLKALVMLVDGGFTPEA